MLEEGTQMKHGISSMALLAALALATSATAQGMSPTETYLAYHRTIIDATSWDEIAAFSTAEKRAEALALSEQEKSENLGLIKIFVGAEENLAVVSETIDGDQATVKTEYCSDGKRGATNVSLMLEDGEWKIAESASEVGSEACGS